MMTSARHPNFRPNSHWSESAPFSITYVIGIGFCGSPIQTFERSVHESSSARAPAYSGELPQAIHFQRFRVSRDEQRSNGLEDCTFALSGIISNTRVCLTL